jgi:hypothetical protein
MAGVTISESSIEIKMPPMTAIASGRTICDPAPSASASGSIPATAANAVITIGRSRRRPACDRFVWREPNRSELLVRLEQQDAVLGDNPDHHDQSHEGRDVERGPVMNSVKNTPDVDRIADTR